jgi:hypothetical protein
VFQAKNDDHRVLHGVYFIPAAQFHHELRVAR